MIEIIEGEVARRGVGYVVIMTKIGVGYRVLVPDGEEYDEGAFCRIWTHQVFRETDSRLFGFKSIRCLDLFRDLIQLKGVGPVGAQALLNGGADLFLKAVREKDSEALQKHRGVGKKLSQDVVSLFKESPTKCRIPTSVTDD